MYKYDSVAGTELYQRNPLFDRPSLHKPRSWTETIQSFINNAHELSQCLLRNMKLTPGGYSLAVTINVRADLSIDEIKSVWKKATRKMRSHGVVALWVREPNRRDRCNYHLIVSTPRTQKEMEEILEISMPSRKEVMWHKQVRPIKSPFVWAKYICKAKMSGSKKGKLLRDMYAGKRLLFHTRTGLDKFGTIGPFWKKPKAILWKEIQDREKRIATGLDQPNVKAAAKFMFDYLGLENDPHITLKDVERSFGSWPESEGVQHWIERLTHEQAGQ